MPKVQLAHGEIEDRRDGPEDGPAIVFVHGALVNGSLVILATCLAKMRANFGFELSPVPTAVPPCASGYKSFTATRNRAMPLSTWAA